jgi:hypothetical protein
MQQGFVERTELNDLLDAEVSLKKKGKVKLQKTKANTK